jgi:hypothetical protein
VPRHSTPGKSPRLVLTTSLHKRSPRANPGRVRPQQ